MKMVEVTVKFYGQLQSVVNEKSKRVKLNHYNLVGGLVDTLIQQYGELLKDELIDPQTHQLNTYTQIFVNKQSLTSLQGLKTELKEGDHVIFLPPFAGD
jgi:MoaD family protein